MSERQADLRRRLIRNLDDIEKERQTRPPRYDTLCARLAAGTEAVRLGISVDTVAAGKVSCLDHCHHSDEEAFVILEGSGTLRVAGERLPISAGDTIFIPAGPDYPHQIENTSDAPLEYLSISTRDALDVVEYPDSGKVLIQSRSASTSTVATAEFGSRVPTRTRARLLGRRAMTTAARPPWICRLAH